MDATKLTEKLQARRREITDQMESLVSADGISTGEGIAFGEPVGEDRAAAVQRMTQLNMHSGLEAELATVDVALGKIEEGTYGTCDICGKAISDARLEALPWATSCVDCS